jgi:AhpD family alkylhydroperoxidase
MRCKARETRPHNEELQRHHERYFGVYRGAAQACSRGNAGLLFAGEGGKHAGSLDKKTKGLIALAIGVTQRCDGCIGFHAKALNELDASRQEIAEVLAMTVYMGGDPALMYAAGALRAYDQFAAA